MLDNINKLNQTQMKIKDELHNAQLLQKKTQIFYLQGQVSPHFLYNSMMHIQGVALKHNVSEIVNMTNSLSKVFRYFSSNVTISTIKQDLDVAIDYFHVINMRRANPVGINYDMDTETLNTQIIKMVFQPILENILKHAFSSGSSGTLSISSKPPEGGYSIVTIQDNGKGIPSDKLEEVKKSLSENTFLSAYNQTENVGLLNVHTRLKMYYGPECGITIDSKLNYGTTVWVKVKSHTTDHG
jgi:two-component system sensor histidine kinase YesM